MSIRLLATVADFCPIKAIGSDPTAPYSFVPAMELGT